MNCIVVWVAHLAGMRLQAHTNTVQRTPSHYLRHNNVHINLLLPQRTLTLPYKHAQAALLLPIQTHLRLRCVQRA